MAFAGYLLATFTIEKDEHDQDVIVIVRTFPNQYIKYESWSSNPDQREEIKAYRDDNTRNLTRVTAPGRKSVFSFTTRDGLNLSEKQDIQDFFTSMEVDHDQRKIQLMFWNDETNSYDTGYFYRPNMDFVIKKITDTDIIYKELKMEFIEY